MKPMIAIVEETWLRMDLLILKTFWSLDDHLGKRFPFWSGVNTLVYELIQYLTLSLDDILVQPNGQVPQNDIHRGFSQNMGWMFYQAKLKTES